MMAKENFLTVVVKEPGEKPYVDRLFPNTLEAFQATVGGYIETVTLDADCTDCIVIVNEEGRLKGLPKNCLGLRGTVVFVRQKGDEFASLKQSAVKLLLERL